MNEQTGKRRDWIKNATIVFLIIMLLLTFFSNTIMNYSLPEVSAQYVTNGTIQAKVRGSGTVSAGNPYSVKSQVSRTIMAVAVKDGAHVQKGDVLFYLEEGESTELKAALKTLEDLQEQYRQKALAANIDPDDTNKMLNGQFTDFNTYYVQVQNLKREIQTLEDEINIYKTEIEKVKNEQQEYKNSNGGADSEQKKQDYEAAKAVRTTAQKTFDDAKAMAVAASLMTSTDTMQTVKTKAEAAKSDAEAVQKSIEDTKKSTEYEQAEVTRVAVYEKAVADAKAKYEAAVSGTDEQAKEDAKKAWNEAVSKLEAYKVSGVYATILTAEANLATANVSYNTLTAVLNADTALSTAITAENNAKALYEAAGSNHTTAIEQLQNIIDKNQAYVDEQTLKMTEKQTALNDLLSSMNQNTEMQNALEAIEEQKEVIEKLRGGTSSGDIVAPISGTVSGISLKAGDSTPIGGEVATIVPDGTGFTMEVTVTKEQAQRLSKGDVADVQNAWYYSDVSVVLTQIKTDRNNPSTNKILVFNVEGDVADGQSLSISIGQKSANYDCLVPNSAIREDNNGKFILKVSQKSSPLGNRYYAERVDVEVLASDDTQSAIKGALEGWEFVITTSTKPVEAGQLVRLPD